jgi:general secretion pathway protein G
MSLKKWMSTGFFPAHSGKKALQKGLTLIEIIIVVALIGTLMTIIVRNLTQQADTAKEGQAKIGMANVAQALQLYKVQTNHYPTTEQGLNAMLSNPGEKNWRGPYAEEKQLKDPWGTPYDYTSDGRTFEIICAGKDQTVGTEDDLHYPDRAEGAAGAEAKPAASE